MKETEQTLLDKIKNDVAKSYGWADFAELHRDNAEQYDLRMSSIVDDIAKLYAEDKAKASCEATLKKAAENAKTDDFFDQRTYETRSSVDKSSITDPSNIVIV